MPRDHRQLRSFVESDALAAAVYELTASFPEQERYATVSQLRRAALSVPSNIVEGCARRSTADYTRFLEIALGLARECAYLMEFCAKCGVTDSPHCRQLAARYTGLCVGLVAQIRSLRSER